MDIFTVDAIGCACPEPVLMTKKALTSNPNTIKVLVDNNTAVQNIMRFAAISGYGVNVAEQGDGFILTLKK